VIRISLQQASQGDRLAKPVFGLDATMLLNSGVELNDDYLARLREHGVSEICVYSPDVEGVAAEDAVSDASRIEAIACAHECVQAASENRALPAQRLLDVVEGVADDLGRNRGGIIAVSSARCERDWWEVHASNVALLSLATAEALGLDRAHLAQLGIGAMLHDIGLIGLSSEPMHALDQEAIGPRRSHTVIGFQSLITNADISATSAVISLQHHERLDGSGFPKGLSGGPISIAVQICAAADVYDLMIAPPPFGRGISAHHALRDLRAQAAVAVEPVMAAFARAIAPYPPGTVLRLRDGSSAVVREARAIGAASLPVHIVSKNGGSGPVELDLANDGEVAIEESQ
jgi:HD-GYP domain-containing protein (c-di-GMP phosphodiesterase class II)